MVLRDIKVLSASRWKYSLPPICKKKKKSLNKIKSHAASRFNYQFIDNRGDKHIKNHENTISKIQIMGN